MGGRVCSIARTRECLVPIVLILFFGMAGRAVELPDGALGRLGTTSLRIRQGVTGVSFSPDNTRLAGVGWGDSIRVWDVSTGRQVRRLRLGGGSFVAMWSRDGKRLVCTGGAGRVGLWDLETESEVFSAMTDQERVTGVAWSPDGVAFATGGGGEPILLWDAETGEELLRLHTVNGGQDVHPVAFSPSGELLASGDSRGTIRVWNLATGKTTEYKVNEGRETNSIAFMDETQFLAVTEYYDRPQRKFNSVFAAYECGPDGIRSLGAPFDIDGGSLFVVSNDRARLVVAYRDKLTVWNPRERKLLRAIRRPRNSFGLRTHSLAISSDNRFVASAWGSHKVHLHNLETGEELFPHDDSHHGGVLTIAESADGKMLATGDESGTVHLWDTKNLSHVRGISLDRNWVRSVRFFPDGSQLLVTGEFHESGKPRFVGRARIIDVVSGEVKQLFELDDRGMRAAISDDGKRIAFALGMGRRMAFGPGEDAPEARILVRDLTDAGEPLAISAVDGNPNQLFFHGDSLYAVHATKLRQWNSATGKEVSSQLVGGEDSFGASAFSPTSNIVLAAWHEYSRKPGHSKGFYTGSRLGAEEPIWKQVLTEARVSLLATSNNGERFAAFVRRGHRAAELPNEIIVGRCEDGTALTTFKLDDGSVRSIAFSNDGQRLYTGMDRGDILVWDVAELPE